MADFFSQEGAFQHALNIQATARGGAGRGGAGGGNYGKMLADAQKQYSGILQGYQNTLRGQRQQQQQTMQGYNQLQSSVLGGLAGAGTARSQEIADQYTRQAGQAQQDLVNRGLGNTTVTSSVGRGYALDQSKAQNDLADQLRNQVAGYQSQLGLAGLGFRDQAGRQNTALQGARLGYQGDYQRQLGGWAMQGLGMENQLRSQQMQNYSRGGGGGGGRGVGGGYKIGGGSPEGYRPGDEMVPNPLANPYFTPMQRPETTWIGGGALPVAQHGRDYTAGIHDWDLAGEYN